MVGSHWDSKFSVTLTVNVDVARSTSASTPRGAGRTPSTSSVFGPRSETSQPAVSSESRAARRTYCGVVVLVIRSSSCELCPRRFRRMSRNRSEEHTSELQSRGHLVCRLLLEKKKHET